LFADFGIALYADSIPGVARSAVPQANRFTTRNLRVMYAALFCAAGPSADVPRGFQIGAKTIPSNQLATGAMEPGTVSYYRLDTPANATSVQLRFASSTGTALPSSLRPQIAIFRLPPGT
jgi:hypothetical protein